MSKVKLEHIDALTKGKKSGIRIGSRAIPHHLYQYERDEYERSLKRGYLILDKSDRINLENIWILVCESKKINCLILHKVGDQGMVTSNGEILFDGNLSDAKKFIKSLP